MKKKQSHLEKYFLSLPIDLRITLSIYEPVPIDSQ